MTSIIAVVQWKDLAYKPVWVNLHIKSFMRSTPGLFQKSFIGLALGAYP